jgi:hypothetical protein
MEITTAKIATYLGIAAAAYYIYTTYSSGHSSPLGGKAGTFKAGGLPQTHRRFFGSSAPSSALGAGAATLPSKLNAMGGGSVISPRQRASSTQLSNASKSYFMQNRTKVRHSVLSNSTGK